MTRLFIADLHLEDARPEATERFLRFLEGPAATAAALYILGDLFEVWIGDDHPGLTGDQVAHGIRRLTQSGVPVYFMHGNRDFLVGLDYCRLTGMELLRDPVDIDLGGQATLLSHGDTLCTDDVAYQRFRRRIRSPLARSILCNLPVRARLFLSRRARDASRRHTRSARPAIMDVNPEAVAECFKRHRITRLIHGHTHRPAIHDLTVDGRRCQRVVLGDWGKKGSFLQAEGDEIALKSF